MDFEEYSKHVNEKLKKAIAGVDRWVERRQAGAGPVRFCSQCGERMIIRSSRKIDDNHKEYFYVCAKCTHKEMNLVRRIDIEHIFLDKTSLDDIDRFISAKEIDENLNLINEMVHDIDCRLQADRQILLEHIDLIDKKYEVLTEKIKLIYRKIDG